MTQKEFDARMTEYNNQQYSEKSELELKKQEHFNEISRLRTEIVRLHKEIDDHRSQIHRLDVSIKDVNIKYHNLKHELVVDNPKSSMTV